MTRLEILKQTIEESAYELNEEPCYGFIEQSVAIEAMKRFGELAFMKAYTDGYEIGRCNLFELVSEGENRFKTWLKEQEEPK